MAKLRIGVAGAAGRMGRAVIRAISEAPDCVLAAALVRKGHPETGNDAGVLGTAEAGITLVDDAAAALRDSDAIVDFSAPLNSVELAKLAAKTGTPHILGTTGFSGMQEAQIAAAAERTVIVKSGNMSLGVTLLSSLVKRAAAVLPEFDAEVLEMHHRGKVDAPSGTALLLGHAVAEGRGIQIDENSELCGDRRGPRREGTIGFASLRGGTVAGEHQVIFAGPHERIVLSHVAEDRIIFASGALAAARWSQGKPAGLYTMADVLNLRG